MTATTGHSVYDMSEYVTLERIVDRNVEPDRDQRLLITCKHAAWSLSTLSQVYQVYVSASHKEQSSIELHTKDKSNSLLEYPVQTMSHWSSHYMPKDSDNNLFDKCIALNCSPQSIFISHTTMRPPTWQIRWKTYEAGMISKTHQTRQDFLPTTCCLPACKGWCYWCGTLIGSSGVQWFYQAFTTSEARNNRDSLSSFSHPMLVHHRKA